MNVKIKLFLSKMNAASSNKLTQRFMTIRSYINEKNFKLAVKIVLGLVFIVSGISKLIDPELLTIQLEGFKFLNPFVIEIIAYSLIVLFFLKLDKWHVEISCGFSDKLLNLGHPM